MGKKRFTDEQIVRALRQTEGGEKVGEICRQLGISEQTYYTWKQEVRGPRPERTARMTAIAGGEQ